MRKNKKQINNYLKIINQIEKVRAKNNKYWMDLYRLAFINNPKEASKIVKKILIKDNKISELASKLKK